MKTRLLILAGTLSAIAVALLLATRPGGMKPHNKISPANTTHEVAARLRPAPDFVELSLADTSFLLSHHLNNLREALAQEPEALARTLAEMSDFLEMNPEAFGSAISEMATDPSLNEHLPLLAKASANLQRTLLADVFQSVSLSMIHPDQPVEWKERGVFALGYAAVDESLLAAISDIARTETDPRVRASAVGTLAAWLMQDNEWRAPVVAALSRVARFDPQREVRADALRILISHQRELPDTLRDLINGFLSGQPSVEDRLMVAATVGHYSPGNRDLALTHFEAAYLQAGDIALKRQVLSQMARYGGADTPKWMEQLPVDAPLLARDVRDYREIFAEGLVHPDAILEQKARRDARHGTPLSAKERPH